MINRKIAPGVNTISKINFTKPEKLILANGVKLYNFHSDNSPVIKLDVIFNAGIENETKKLQAVFANALIKESPKGMQPDETSEYFDYYGSFVEGFLGNDTGGLRLFVPKIYFKDVLPVFADLFKNPLLPEKEFEILRNKHHATLKNNLQKTKYVAMRGLNTELFGAAHPRGYIIEPDDTSKINIEEIRSFVSENYSLQDCFIQISGMTDDESVKLCDKYLSQSSQQAKYKNKKQNTICESKDTTKIYELAASVQSTIAIGKNLGKLSEAELIDLDILNTVLGGYFGSRLMKNIREDKGYTYGIQSFISEYNDCITLKVLTDVGTDVTQNAVNEIYKEIAKLAENTVHYSELNLVRNFMLGEMIGSFDGVLQTSSIWEKLVSTGKSENFIKNQISRIRTITPAELKFVAEKHLKTEGFHTVVAGKM